MNSEYLNRLPKDIQHFVARLEYESDIEIEVVIDKSRADRYLDEPDPLACTVNEYEAEILITAPYHFPENSVFHELLHIERFLVKQAPQIIPCEECWSHALEKCLTVLDNHIEHLVIVPIELQQRPDRINHWITVMNHILHRIETSEITGDDQAYLIIYSWFFISHILKNNTLTNRSQSLLKLLGLLDHATQFKDRIIPALSSKEEATTVFIEQFKINKECICFHYFDSKNRSSNQTKYSEHRMT